MKKKKLFLLDVYPILYRSHFAMMNQHLRNSAGLNTSAIHGFCNYLFQIIFKEKPTHIAAAFDSRSLERTAVFGGYKATRDKIPEDIIVAKTYIQTIIDALNIKSIEMKGYEADDVIGTIAGKALKAGMEVYIVSPDKDFAQLATDQVLLYRPSYKGLNFEVLNGEQVREKYGVPPVQIPDLLALKGDAADNIPGVPKIGEKTALELLSRYKTVEALLEKREEITKASIRQTLIDHEETARLSKQLAIINTALPLDFREEEYKLRGPETDVLVRVLDELEFIRLKERIFSNTFYKKTLDQQTGDNLFPDSDNAISFQEIGHEGALEALLKEAENTGRFCFLTTPRSNYLDLYFLAGNQVNLYSVKGTAIPAALRTVFESEKIRKITYQVKGLVRFLMRHGHALKGPVHDTLLLHYIISPDANHQLDRILAQEMGFAFQNSSASVQRRCAETMALPSLDEKLEAGLNERGQMKLYKEIDLPLVAVIGRMEQNGIKIDTTALQEISRVFQEEMDKVEKRIFEIAGQEFNLRSSKQTADLFSRIFKDSKVKKTKTGQFSTSEATLLEFAGEHEIAEQLLRFRRLSKLVSTYTESLPKYIDPKTGRIHAEFLQVTTATGRLSCINPNLQNLPIRTEEGREVRKAIVPEGEDHLILSADYSQIELRLLAALSHDEGLAQAFARKQDVHTITAARVFNVDERAVTDDMRSKAKMVNYGIAYGISAFGLSQRLKISMSEAKEIITNYFAQFPRIRQYIESTIGDARRNKYTITETGRRRYIEDIDSKNGTERRAAERIAINAPIQGLAADLIKLSMIQIDDYLQRHGLKSRLIMQVHDELVFEVPSSELKEMARVVREKMEGAIPLSVPIEVNVGVGHNWLDLEDYTDDK